MGRPPGGLPIEPGDALRNRFDCEPAAGTDRAAHATSAPGERPYVDREPTASIRARRARGGRPRQNRRPAASALAGPSAGVPAPTVPALHDALFAALGPQGWWPAETAEEVVIGAILTQAVAWSNVERAIANLRAAGLLTLDALADADPTAVAPLIRPAGYFNVKARKLQAVARALRAIGGLPALERMALAQARARLLAVFGIGPETADAILNYAADQPTFVADAYARRVLGRIGTVPPDADYESVRKSVVAALPGHLLGEFHALLVAVGKNLCRPRDPRCGDCPANRLCAEGGRKRDRLAIADKAGSTAGILPAG